MLYVTTRGTQDAFTAYRTARQDRGPDGGFFVPMQIPSFDRKDIQKLASNSFGQNVADLLNLLFGTKISRWDVDVVIGRIFTTKPVGHKLIMGHLWDEVHGDFSCVVRSLSILVSPELSKDEPIPNWLEIAIRIAVIFAVYGDLLAAGSINREKAVDFAVTSGSFAMPMALWYARKMGLPVGTIICGCNENGAVWDLLHRGAVDTGVLSVETSTPDADYAVPPNLERLIHATLGHEEALRYWWCGTEGRNYLLPELDGASLSTGMFAAVVSMDRISNIIPMVHRTHGYILEPYSSLAYGALSDYRARTGVVNTAIVLMERSPVTKAAEIAEYMHIPRSELLRLLSEER